MAKRRRFTAVFKARVALEALREEKTVQSIATRHQVHPNQVSQWKRKVREGLAEVFEGGRSKRIIEEDFLPVSAVDRRSLRFSSPALPTNRSLHTHSRVVRECRSRSRPCEDRKSGALPRDWRPSPP